MPLYEYECGTCRRRFELRQKMTDESIRVCPSCGEAVRRVIQPVGIIFKGSGWYINDSRKSETVSATTDKTDKGSSDKESSEKAAETRDS